MDERIEALQANRERNEQWNQDCKRLDPEDKAILHYRLDHEEKMLQAGFALSRLQQRQHSTASRPADHRRLAEKLAPQCLRDGLAKINDEIDKRTNVGKITVGSNPKLLTGPMYRAPTPAEQEALARAQAAKLALENLYTLEADIEPLVLKIFADLRLADNEAEQVELQQSTSAHPGQKTTKNLTLAQRESLALAAAGGGFRDDGIAAEIEVG